MKRTGFSLVELSIVLVILGLLVGGVLSGQALIHAAELRSVLKERDQVVSAIQTFRDKYFALPGDMSNATRFWLRQKSFNEDGNPGGCITNSGAGWGATRWDGVCDGDGNGRIEPQNALTATEDAQFWKHLISAQLMNGSIAYPGVNYGASMSHPPSKFPNGYWSALYVPPASGQPEAIDDWSSVSLYLKPQNLLTIGGTLGNLQAAHAQLFTAEDAWNIDAKADDGKPYSGSIWSPWDQKYIAGVGLCTTSPTAVATYAVSVTGQTCALAFLGLL